jgi:hypothetical protein
MKLGTLWGMAAVAGLALSLYAQQSVYAPQCQPPREMRAAVENMNFAEGAPGAPPPGWYLGPEWFMPPHTPVYEAQVASGAACNGGNLCATVHSIRDDRSIQLAFLYQVLDAAQYRGKRVTFRAGVRVARLLVRVHRTDCSTSFRDDMGSHPITAGAWATYEIQAPIDPDARDIEFGMQLIGRGAAWIDNVSMDFAAIGK